MTEIEFSRREVLESFVRLSSALTGYDETTLWGTGLAQAHFAKLLEEAGPDVTRALLGFADDADQVFNEDALVPKARAVIKLWYVGQWYEGKVPGGTASFQLSPTAYANALAWRAMGGHPQGARQPGYGSWVNPPVGAQEDDA